MRFPLLTVIVTIVSFGVVLAGTVDIYSVTGHSMEPVVFPGQFVLIERLSYRVRDPRYGELIVAHDPISGRLILKQCVGIDENNLVYVQGTNRSISIDSRYFGGLPLDHVRGRVLLFGGHRNG